MGPLTSTHHRLPVQSNVSVQSTVFRKGDRGKRSREVSREAGRECGREGEKEGRDERSEKGKEKGRKNMKLILGENWNPLQILRHKLI